MAEEKEGYVHELRTCALAEIPEVVQRIGDVNVRGRNLENALHNLDDSPERCKMLIKYGADVNCEDSFGRSPLHLVRNPRICKILLEHGADVNARDILGQTPLHYFQNLEISQILIENGADIDAIDADGYSLLMYLPRDDIVYLLLYHNADVQIKNKSGDNAMSLSIKGFIERENTDLIEILFYLTYLECKEPISSELISELGLIPELSHIFKQLVETCTKIQFANDLWYYQNFLKKLFQYELDHLRLLLSKFKNTVVKCFKIVSNSKFSLWDFLQLETYDDYKNSENIIMVLAEYNLLEDFIREFYSEFLDAFCLFAYEMTDEEQSTHFILTLVSHGLELEDYILNEVYSNYGDCELFRILLHCDVIKIKDSSIYSVPVAQLIFEIDLTIDDYLKQDSLIYLRKEEAEPLLEYFTQPALVQFCLTQYGDDEDFVAQLKQISKVPKLAELARDVTRQHIVKKYRNPREFYTYIERLDISHVCKDILSLRRTLYTY